MKKLLVLFVVLALATSVSATDVYVDAESGGSNAITVLQGATVVVDLTSNTICGGIGDTEEGEAGWWVTADVGITLPATGDFNDILDTVTSNSLTRLFAIYSGTSEIGVPVGEPIFTFSLTAPSTNGDYDITVNYSATYAAFWDEGANDRYADLIAGTDLTITVIPEPMTIALLGLGGLLLRRKK